MGRVEVVALLVTLVTLLRSEGCPLVCTCKWKGGKQTVECRNQGLETLPEGIDPETQVLDISGNKLGVLPKDAFRQAGLLNLQKIHLRNSRLTQIDPGAFSELINLVEIDLGDNLLQSVPSQAFLQTPFVRELNLGGNPMKSLRNGAFRHLPQLVKLDLSRCHLTHIDDQAFAHLQLESLKINSNQLPIISNATVKSLSQLHGMELHDNPWECDCRLRPLKMWIETRNIPHPISPTCHAPPRLAGRRFAELPLSEFACSPRIVPSSRQVTVVEGDNATFDCLFEAVPAPTVRWYLFGRPIANNTLISFSRKFLIFQEDSRSSLVLTHTDLKDGGDFFCVVENPDGFVEANFSLLVLPQPPFPNLLDSNHILVIVLATVGILIILLLAVALFLWSRYRWPLSARSGGTKGEVLVSSTPVKPPRTNYEINPGSLVGSYGNFGTFGSLGGGQSGLKSKESTDNPDLILETNNSTVYQEGVEEESSNSELNWEQQSYLREYGPDYPLDYGLPIIQENNVFDYSDSSHYGNGSVSHLSSVGGGGGQALSGVWNKNKVGARITAPNARDSPDEGYQEGYVGTDV